MHDHLNVKYIVIIGIFLINHDKIQFVWLSGW